MSSKASQSLNCGKTSKPVLPDQENISKHNLTNNFISEKTENNQRVQNTQKKRKKSKDESSPKISVKKSIQHSSSENALGPEPPASLETPTENNVTNSMSHFHNMSMESPLSSGLFPLSSGPMSSSLFRNLQSSENFNAKVAPSPSPSIGTGSILVKKHPPPRLASQNDSQDLKSSQYVIFVKPDTSIMALVQRAISKLKDIEGKHTKRTFITLKALGRAIDTATIVAIRLQQMGYFVTFKTSSEKVLDEMAVMPDQVISKKTAEPAQAEPTTKDHSNNNLKKHKGKDKQIKVCSAVEKIVEEGNGNSSRVRNVSSISIDVYILKEEYVGMDSYRRMNTYDFSAEKDGKYPLPFGMSLDNPKKG